MTPRDAQGRFTTAQHADALAAERLLERAVAEARGQFVFMVEHDRHCGGSCAEVPCTRADVQGVLDAALVSAELLMGGAA